jgi:hypothetical protein
MPLAIQRFQFAFDKTKPPSIRSGRLKTYLSETSYSENTLDGCICSRIQAVVSVIHDTYDGMVIYIAVLHVFDNLEDSFVAGASEGY